MADQPITGQYLANINQVTPRTIREDIKHLNELLKERGAKVNSVISKGYQLEVSDDQCFRNFLQAISVDQSSKDRIPSTPEERTAYIIKRLLLSNKYIKLDDLADELYVSKSTIQLDLKTVKQILQEYEITLDPKPNYGLKAVGDEIKFRFCLSEYLFHRDHQKRNPIIESEFYDVSQEETEKIYQIIINQIEKHHITLSDIAINNLLIHICIAYKRIINGHYVAIYHNDSKEIQQQKEFQVAKEIAAEVEKAYQIVFPEEEVVYIAMHLLGTKLLSHTSSDLDNMLDSDTFQLVKYILQKVEEQLDLNIKDDEELLLGLRLHLKPALNRIKFGMNIRNPLLADIKISTH